MLKTRRTKIVCTIGPACETREQLHELARAGLNVARLNFSHGTLDWHRERIALLRELSRESAQPIGILQDLCGPKLRLGSLPSEGLRLPTGQTCWLTPGGESPDGAEALPVPVPGLLDQLAQGDPVYLRDAQLQLEVLERRGGAVRCLVVLGGMIFGRQGITAPTVRLAIPSATEKDLADLRGAGALVDWVALSFVRQADDLAEVRRVLSEVGSKARLMAKIEHPEALANFDAILEAADGIMIARGDLGVEIPIQRIPMVQKSLIARCNQAGKPVITATQMLESMMTSPRPTRAEVTDVANAILDGTDAVMLSGETAAGQWPTLTVGMMESIALAAEEGYPYEDVGRRRTAERAQGVADALAQGAWSLATDLDLAAILCWSETGATARRLARLRPQTPVLAFTSETATYGQLALSWGVEPVLVQDATGLESRLSRAVEQARKMGLSEGQTVALLADDPSGLRQGRLVELLTL